MGILRLTQISTNARNQKFDKKKKSRKDRTILMHKVVKFTKRVKSTDRLTAS